MQEGGDHRRHVETQFFGGYVGHRYGMKDIRLSGLAFLGCVCHSRKVECFADLIHIRGTHTRLHNLENSSGTLADYLVVVLHGSFLFQP